MLSFVDEELIPDYVPRLIDMLRNRSRPCHLCGEIHEDKPPLFCNYCLNVISGAYTVKKMIDSGGKVYYTIWHHDDEGRRICAACYRRFLIRRKKAGRPIRSNSPELQELQQIAAELKARKPPAKPPVSRKEIEPYLTV